MSLQQEISTSSRDLTPSTEAPGEQRRPIRRQRSRATVRSVAEAAGVSVATVSRVLSGSSKVVSPTVQGRVEEAVRRLHYTPNQLIRSLQRGRTQVIAVTSFYPGLFSRDEQQTRMTAEVCLAARYEGYDVLLPSGSLQPDGCPSVASLLDGRCDGVILEAPNGISMLDDLAEQGFPTVVIGNRSVPEGIGSVQSDNTGGVKKAMDHLLNLGHRRIAHLAGPIRLWDEAQARLDEYRRALYLADVRFDPLLIWPFEGSVSWEAQTGDVEAAVHLWLSLPDPPTAVFCASDRLALVLMRVVTQRGLRIPNQLSVVGYDDIPMVRHSIPPMTTVSVDLSQQAVSAVRMLRTFVEDSKPDRGVSTQLSHREITRLEIAEANLIIRGSTARLLGKRNFGNHRL